MTGDQARRADRASQDGSIALNSAARLATAVLQHAGSDAADAARLLSLALPGLNDPALVQGVLKALRQACTSPYAQAILDMLWQTWQDTRLPALAALLVELDQPASHPLSLRVLSALQLYNLTIVKSAGAMAVEPLLTACRDADPAIAHNALQALQELPDPSAQAEVCRWVLEHDHPQARQIALAAGFVPIQPQERALFYLLTGQWGKYEALDYDARLLEAVYAASSESLRQQIAQAARHHGWSGFVQAAGGGRSRRRMAELSDFEWEAVLVILGREQRWAEVWQLAQAAPPTWSARLLRGLHEAGWMPPVNEEQPSFKNFVAQAIACLGQSTSQGLRVQHHAALYGHTRQITALAMLPRYDLVATASADRSLRLWSLTQGRLVKILQGHADFILSLAVAPDESWLASGSADKTVHLWSVPDGSPLHTLGGHAGRVIQLATIPDGSMLISGDERSVYFWRFGEHNLVHCLRNQFNGLVALAVSGNGNLLLTGDNDRTVKVWTLPGGELLHNLLAPLVGWALSPDGRYLASSSSYSAIQLWRLPEGEIIRSLPGRANNMLLAFSPDGHWLACAERSNVLLWQLTGDISQVSTTALTLQTGAGLSSAIAFSPDSQILATGNQDRSLRLWQLPTGELIKTLEGYTTPLKHLAFTPDGSLLASTDELSLQLWRLDDLSTLFRTPSSQINPIQLEERLSDPELSPGQRLWLEFSLSLARWQRRFDIELQELAPDILVGDYDIEIEI